MPHAEQKIISCAIIGSGAFGAHYIRLLQNNPRAQLRAVVSPGIHARQLAVDATTKLSTNVEEILDDTSIDAVIIATPLSTHAKLATMALRAGKHVLLEKPFAMNMDEAKEIQGVVVSSKKVFLLGHQYLYNDDVANLKNEIDNGRIGVGRYVHAEQLYASKIRHDVGCFREAATHEIALIDYLFSPGAPTAVEASALDLSGGMREDFATATIHYESGLFVHIVISSYSPIKSRRMIIGGDAGMAIFDDMKTEDKVTFNLRPFPRMEKVAQSKSLPIPEGETFVPKITDRREPLAQEVEHFLDCINNGAIPHSDIAHAMRVERVLEAFARAVHIA